MSTTVPPRSNTGCLTCKTRRKKCDETKPKCLRCQRLGVECPGYVYMTNKNKRVQRLRTLPAPPRINAPMPNDELRNRAAGASSGSILPNPVLPNISSTTLQDNHTPGCSESSALPDHQLEARLKGVYPGTTTGGSVDFSWVNATVGDFDMLALSDPWMNHSNTSQTHNKQTPVLDDQPQQNFPPPLPMPNGQASLPQGILNPGRSRGSPLQLSKTSGSSSFSDATPTWDDEDDTESEDEDPEGAIMIISRMPVLDSNVESNALPFVLQNYAAWINRRAFEPLKMTSIARDLVFSHFERDQSRWALTLLANMGGALARTNYIKEEHMAMLSALEDTWFRQTATAGAESVWKTELAKVLEMTLEAMSMHIFVSPIPRADKLRRAVAPIVRRLCLETPGKPINLTTQPLFCLRYYAYLDITAAALSGFPMMFRYDITDDSIWDIRADSPQWLIGVPDKIVFVLAKINALREDGYVPPGVVSELEEAIRGFRPVQSVSVDSYLTVTRVAIQECWRQAAHIYLYMGLLGESSEGTRVIKAMKQLMTLLRRTKPGRFLDEFLSCCLLMAAPAARRPADRQVLVKRLTCRSTGSLEGGIADNLRLIEDCWARADAEGRPVVWSDVVISRIRIVGM